MSTSRPWSFPDAVQQAAAMLVSALWSVGCVLALGLALWRVGF